MDALHKLRHVKNIWLTAHEHGRKIAYDPEPIGRYNVAPGTKVLLLSERDGQLHLDPVFWGYAPDGGISHRLSMRASKLRPPAECLNLYGSMGGQSVLLMVGSNGKRTAAKSSLTSSIARMVNPSLWRQSAVHRSNAGMKRKVFDCDGSSRPRSGRYSRPPPAGSVTRGRTGMGVPDISGKEAEVIAAEGAVSADKFIWHAVTRAVGNVKNQDPELIEPVT